MTVPRRLRFARRRWMQRAANDKLRLVAGANLMPTPAREIAEPTPTPGVWRCEVCDIVERVPLDKPVEFESDWHNLTRHPRRRLAWWRGRSAPSVAEAWRWTP